MLSWLRRTVVWLLIFLIELAICLALFIAGMAFWRARVPLREAQPVRVVAPAHHPQLNFACQLDTPALQSLFSNPEVIRNLRQLNAGVTLSLVDLSAGRAQVVRRLNSAGIPVTAWLALPGSQGYYVNASNSAEVGERFSAFQKWTADWGLHWAGVGLDIEPSLQEFSSIRGAISSAFGGLFDSGRVTRARVAYKALITRIQADGYSVETYQFPFIADERQVHSTLLERLFGIVDVRGNREVLMLYSSFHRSADSALIWEYGPSAQYIAVGVTDGKPQPAKSMGPLTWEELSRDIIVASHFSPMVGIYNLEGSARRGFLPQLELLDWNQPVTISAEQIRQMIRFRARVQAALWTLSHLPYLVLAILLADASFVFLRRHVKQTNRVQLARKKA